MPFQPDEDVWLNPAAPVAASNSLRLPLGEQDASPIFGNTRTSQDVTLALATQVSSTRDSQDVLLVLSPSKVLDELYWLNPVAPVAATLYQRLPLGDPEELPAGAFVLANPDQDYWQNPSAPIPASLYQQLPLGDPEEIPAATLVGFVFHPDEDYWQNPSFPIPASLYQFLPLGDPEEIAAASLVIGQLDEDFWRNPAAPIPATLWQRLPIGDPEEIPALAPLRRVSQDITLALANQLSSTRTSQDVLLALITPAAPIMEELYWQNPVAPVAASFYCRLPLGDPEELSAASLVASYSRVDKRSIQLHPILKTLRFYSARDLPKQPGKKVSTFTTLLTEAGAPQAFSMPLGARNQPIAGKVFSFTMGGIIYIGNADGTLTITPLYGATANGIDLGRSAVCAYQANTRSAPWRLKGEILFKQVDLAKGAAIAVCTGVFTASGIAVIFGSGKPVQVDLSAVTPSASGALNFAITFAPSVFNVNAPTITTKYAFLRAI